VRVLVVSDIHSNLSALDSVLVAAGTVDAVWQLGDVVGYGPDPDAVVARLAEVRAVGVRGNHDAAAVGDLDTEWFNSYARAAIEWTRLTISTATRRWLQALPERLDEGDVGLRHGSYRDPIWEYISSPAVARASLATLRDEGLAVGLFGHTHEPAIHHDADGHVEAATPSDGSHLALDDRRVLINPGSVGQPRDGIRQASYLVLDTERREATWHRTPYDIAAVQSRMRRAGLPERLALRLEYGL
jgi:predicted phosphodiesterase